MFLKPRLKKLQFSLRAFLAICILLGVYLAIAIPRAQQQKKVADWVRSYGRTPYYSYQMDPTGNYAKTNKPWGPRWLRELFGLDFFYSIRMVHLDDKHVGDISNLGKLHGLQHLELESCNLSGIEPLFNLRQRQLLSINKNAVSDLSPLRNTRTLRVLSANSTQISDISVMESLPSLRVLYIRSTQVSDLTPLRNHASLETLDISLTQVKSLEPLKSIKTLRTLIISGYPTNEDEITSLQEALPNLKIQR